jgi:hypothetical protein
VKFKQIYENYKVKLKIKPKSTLSVLFQENKFIMLNLYLSIPNNKENSVSVVRSVWFIVCPLGPLVSCVSFVRFVICLPTERNRAKDGVLVDLGIVVDLERAISFFDPSIVVLRPLNPARCITSTATGSKIK